MYAEDINQILGDLHYAKVNLTAFPAARPSSRSSCGVTHAPSAAAVRASRGTPRPEGLRITSSLAAFSSGWARCMIRPSGPNLNGHGNSSQGVEMVRQGSPELLHDPVAEKLLGSTIPARLAYTWMDGTPRVVPVWFHWTGEQFVIGSPARAPKLKALAADPHVALTIDDHGWPYSVLSARAETNWCCPNNPVAACGMSNGC